MEARPLGRAFSFGACRMSLVMFGQKRIQAIAIEAQACCGPRLARTWPRVPASSGGRVPIGPAFAGQSRGGQFVAVSVLAESQPARMGRRCHLVMTARHQLRRTLKTGAESAGFPVLQPPPDGGFTPTLRLAPDAGTAHSCSRSPSRLAASVSFDRVSPEAMMLRILPCIRSTASRCVSI